MAEYPRYDIDKLKRLARERLREAKLEPTSLLIYYMVATLRSEELKAASPHARLLSSVTTDVPMAIAGECHE